MMTGRTRPPNTSPLPALMAALELFEGKPHTVSSTHPAPSHLLHTFAGCTYELATLQKKGSMEAAAERRSPPLVGHSATALAKEVVRRRSSNDRDTESSHSHDPRQAGVGASAAAESERLPTTTSYPPMSIRLVCPIPYAQLNQFNNLADVLGTALRQVAPHCVYGLLSPSETGATSAIAELPPSVGLCIPAGVPPRERAAAVAFAADLSIRILQPVVEGLLERSGATQQQESVLLLPRMGSTMETAGSQPAKHTGAIFSAEALFATATPTPVAPVSPGRSSSAQAALAPWYAGTVSLTVCVGTDDEGDAALIRRYLAAFAEVERAPVLLLVRESPEPPSGVSVAAGTTVRAEHSYVWWCTLVFAPHQITSPASLHRGLRWARELRPTVLFHVHQERMAMHAELRQQLRQYAAHFQ
ncbi:hypothetical protein LSCM1_07099 [Leishmania martiniquensis]|uniref:ARP2/3 complex subunit n=1 Tax=Leishmania martiniquensis TaxID=1580590 RepID=A0A836H583_9TRYP|nr:hypothetical protein LSCM1_07099 [Leishmania martiniquensis]